MYTSFARTSQMLTCIYLCFAMHNTCKHMQAQKHTYTHTHAHTHTLQSLSFALESVLKVRFVGEVNLTLLSALIFIMLVFHKIIKARFAFSQVPRYRTS